jgi:hypothetical protein
MEYRSQYIILLALLCGCSATRNHREAQPETRAAAAVTSASSEADGNSNDGKSEFAVPLRLVAQESVAGAPDLPAPVAGDAAATAQQAAAATEGATQETDAKSQQPPGAGVSLDDLPPLAEDPNYPFRPDAAEPEGLAANADGVAYETVIASVHRSYPLVFAAYQERNIADGNQLAAWGQFDTKLKAASENGPLGFYQTYRNLAGFETPLYQGGEAFAGYRSGRGSFQPWYKERETNDSGEFKGGVRVPLIRDREIDERRAELWRRTYDQQIANPVIRANLVAFSREAGFAYWKWVASGQKYRVGVRWLELADKRNEQVKRRVELGDLDPPEQIDNERAIAKRTAKVEEAERILQQSALKLSMFLRTDNGLPYVPTADDLPAFPPLRKIDEQLLERDIARAQQNRPELVALQLELQKLQVDFCEAANMTQPGLDALLVGSQDVGPAASKKGDKSPFELEAGLYFDVPLQRRKGRGKMFAVQAKMSQVTAKRNLVQDKVAAEVRSVYAGLIQSQEQALQAQLAVKLALEMARIELRKFDVGESDLLKVTLREQYALDAAEEEIMAKLNYFEAFTEYAAALAMDRPTSDMLPVADAP